MENEKRLIDANAIPYVQSEEGCLDDYAFRYDINEMSTVDAVEVVHGRWDIDEFGVFCTACKEYAEDDRRTTYCPEYGAKMDGDGNG